MSDDETFVLLSVTEMREKYYLPGEMPPVVSLAPEHVPEGLRHLIPLAERWGISDDLLREDALEKASAAERESLTAAVCRFDDALDEWLAGPEATNPSPTAEYLAFSNMRMAADGC